METKIWINNRIEDSMKIYYAIGQIFENRKKKILEKQS